MIIAIIGSGGREHAICQKIYESKNIKKIFCIPGNGGTKKIAENIEIDINNFDKIKSRFNKGISGRGKALPKKVKAKLESFSKFFSDELSKEDLLNLFGYIPF